MSPRLAQVLSVALESLGNDPDVLAQHITSSLEAAMKTLPAVTTSSGMTTSMNEQCARQMIEAYSHDQKTGFSMITIPAGYSMSDALQDLNEVSLQSTGMPGIEAATLKWMLANFVGEHDLSEPRTLKIKALVEAAEMKARFEQESILAKEQLKFADVRVQALAAVLYRIQQRSDLFRGLSVRGSEPNVTLRNSPHRGVVVEPNFDHGGFDGITASGSPVTAA